MARKGVLIGLLVAVLASTAWAYEPFFATSTGQKLGFVWEGQQIYIAIKDPEKGACGIDQFQVDLMIFDAKTGAWYGEEGAWFRELGGIGSGLYFWVNAQNSNVKVSVQVGSRDCFIDATITPGCFGNTHVLGTISPGRAWFAGAWEYVDEALLVDVYGDPVTFDGLLPFERRVARVDFGNFPFTSTVYEWDVDVEETIGGRFENNDTLILIARDTTDERNIDQDQIKIHDTVGKLTVVPSQLDYGCGPACSNIIVTIEDKDENLNCNEIEYVPFFVIINPGSWNPAQTPGVNNFCNLMMLGGFQDGVDEDLFLEPIRWYNIYEPERWIDYSNAPWWTYGADRLLAVFFAPETSVDSGVFEFNFGNLEDFQVALGLERNDRLPPGTTIAFYYIDPNDFDDMDLATVQVGNRPHSQTFITDANGIPVSEVRIGAGWGGLYVRVYDADANVEACCQDKVVVHICDPHNEDDSEYYVIDEISNDSGIFFSQSGIPLLPVWDAVSGYQLVFDDWKVQAFNEDTIFVRYNSVDYDRESLNALGDGDPNDNDNDEDFPFPPRINEEAARNQYWDVSFAKVKVYDTQVFDGTTHHMRFLDGQYRPVTSIPVSGSLYLEVTDLDQNEHPGMRELIFGGWNKDAAADDTHVNFAEDTMPLWGTDRGTDDRPGLVNQLGLLAPQSITGINESVKVFMFNAQRGTWERMDLRETAVGSGIFRSTTCVLVADARFPGQGNLAAKPGDTIMAFYQDPSNHSDISIISIKVSEGGAGGVTPPTVALSVAFDKANYSTGDTVTITVTDDQYAGATQISGTNPLELKKADGTTLMTWTTIPAVPGQPGKFRVTYQLPADVTGTITAFYVDPMVATRSASAQATVAAPVLSRVTAVKPVPEVFSSSTAFTAFVEPAGAVVDSLKVTVYDLTGKQVATLTGTARSNEVTWNGGTLRNGAYIYVAEAVGAGQVWTFKGYVYIKR
ncbi:MAG: hypothetical protein BIP78_1482 [Candidatus Bipolaricaulis sibiricus]|uniref:FlgD Ig-like domain-containing protein n=1 Tax=Bipolaricaulis sibiricus TaxID=2501609 RepID=A0A410FWD0_BIPS1|nr:MAG: hypothetical protein BIP78_1482 [Candidatus Bipolaricaulis sibiricus]